MDNIDISDDNSYTLILSYFFSTIIRTLLPEIGWVQNFWKNKFNDWHFYVNLFSM